MLMLNFIYIYICVIFSSYLRDCGMYICDILSYCVSFVLCCRFRFGGLVIYLCRWFC